MVIRMELYPALHKSCFTYPTRWLFNNKGRHIKNILLIRVDTLCECVSIKRYKTIRNSYIITDQYLLSDLLPKVMEELSVKG